MFRNIREGDYDPMKGMVWDVISPEAKDLVRRTLVVDPKARFTIDQVQHS